VDLLLGAVTQGQALTFGRLKDRHNLVIAESAIFQRYLLRLRYEKIPLFKTATFRGDYRPHSALGYVPPKLFEQHAA